MSKLPHACQALALVAGLVAATAASTPVHAADAQKEAAVSEPATSDPYQWLEDVTGDKALGWAKQQNARTDAELAAGPEFAKLQSEIRAILDSDAKIPDVEKIGDHYYNFWKDAQHERGLWRRTTLDEYRKPEPQWETVIDLDALNQAEGENWVWHGAAATTTRCIGGRPRLQARQPEAVQRPPARQRHRQQPQRQCPEPRAGTARGGYRQH
jgi:prolyl oligopeptidase